MIKAFYLIICINIIALPLYSQNNEENCYGAAKKYLEENPDVAKARMDPWSHYNRFGKREGRKWYSCESDQKKIEIDCDECKDIVNLYYEAFNKRISFNSIDFFMMKGLVKYCYDKLYWQRSGGTYVLDYKDRGQDCGSKMKEQFIILSGNVIGGIGRDNIWNINRDNLISINIKLKSEIIDNFKKQFDIELIEDCSDCKKNVNEYYESWINKQHIDQLEFETKKSFVQKCQNQKAINCGSKMKKQLEILTGEATGDIFLSKYGNDAKWLILNNSTSLVNLNSIFEDVKKLNNGSQIFKHKDLYGVMDQNGYVYIYPKFKSLQYAKFGNSDYLIVNNNYIIDFNQNEVIKEGIYNEINTDSNYIDFFVFKKLNKLGIVKYNVATNTFNTKEGKIEKSDIFFRNNTCVYKLNQQYGFFNLNGDELLLNENNSYDELAVFSEVNFIKPYWFCKNNNLVRVYLFSKGDFTEVRNSNKYNNISSFDTIVNQNGYKKDIIFAKVQVKDKFGLIDQNFEEVLAPLYDEIIKIEFDTERDDTMVYVKLNNLYGCIDIDKSENDFLYDVPVNFSSLGDVKNQIYKNRMIIELKRQKQEEERLAELKRLENERISEVSYSKNLKVNPNPTKDYITIDNIDIYYKDLGIFNYNDAIIKVEELGDGWRLPSLQESDLIVENLDKIGNLTTVFNRYVNTKGYYTQTVDGAVYWVDNAKALCLRKEAIGFGRTTNLSGQLGQQNFFYSVRPVRINPEMEKKRKQTEDAYAKYVLSQVSLSKVLSGGYSSSDNKVSSKSNNTVSNNSRKKCGYCKPNDDKGWYIHDYDADKKIFINGRYIKNIGHKPCSSCNGTGNCRAYHHCSQYDKSYKVFY